jgi:hypothetical protein
VLDFAITLCNNIRVEHHNIMKKLYISIGGFDYEGDSSSSIRLFDNRDAAEEYCEDLKRTFDYAKIEEREVEKEYKMGNNWVRVLFNS